MATIEHAGKVLRYVGDGPWRDPVLDEDDPSIVYLYADQNGGTASWGSYCQATPVARVVSQTASADTTGFAADSALTCRDAVVVMRAVVRSDHLPIHARAEFRMDLLVVRGSVAM